MTPKPPPDVPVFGERIAGQRYVVRPSAYAIVRSDDGRFAVVATRHGHFLPGGGIEGRETPELAVSRELMEECGLRVRTGPRIGRAIELVHAAGEQTYFEKPSVFLWAWVEASAQAPVEEGHQLLWVTHARAVQCVKHASHAWALRAALAPPAHDDRDPR